MPPQPTMMELNDKIHGLEDHIDDLVRQKNILQRIENYTDKLDFGDLLETYNLLVGEIEKLRERLKSLSFGENEEEEDSSPGNRFALEDRERFLEAVKTRNKQ
jgi:regulator of replication initiation timing